MKFPVSMRFLGHERKLCCVDAKTKGDFYVHLRHDNPPPGFAPLVRHMAYHRSGQRHLKMEAEGIETRRVSAVRLQPVFNFRGVELILHTFVLRGQFSELQLVDKSDRNGILLDCDSAGFRDDLFCGRVYLVEPNKEQEIPTPPDVGPRLLHLEGRVEPWVAVEAFQEKVPGSVD